MIMISAANDSLVKLFAISVALVLVPELYMMQRKPVSLAIISMHGNPLDKPGDLGKCGKGGQNVYVREVGKHLSTLGFNITVFTRSASPDQVELVTLSPTLRVQYIVAGPQQHIFRDLLYHHLDNFTCQIDQTEFEAVFSNYWLSGYVGLKLGLPQVHVHHSLGIQKFQWEPITEIGELRMAVERKINKKVSCVVHQLRNEQELTNATRATHITPGIELEKFRHLDKEHSRNKLHFSSSVINVLYVGRFAAQKGIKFALEALSRTNISLTFRLIGSYDKSPYENFLQEYPQFNYLGAKPMSELVEYMAASDIMVVPSLYEPFGLVVLEGMAAGCCMLVSAVGGPGELVENGVNGLKVPPGDAYVILEAFEELAGNRKLIKEIGETNRKIGLRNSWEKTAEKLSHVILEIVPRRGNVLRRLYADFLSYLSDLLPNIRRN